MPVIPNPLGKLCNRFIQGTDVRNRIFEYLFTTKEVGKGTGLGLAIAQQIIVEKHHGSLSCTSTPGEGTTFIIQLPLT
jgi:two-component system, NtrC family, sensor kinase